MIYVQMMFSSPRTVWSCMQVVMSEEEWIISIIILWKLSPKTFSITSYPRVPTFHDEFEWDYEVTPSPLFIEPSSPALRSIQTIIITSTTHNLLYLTLLRPIKSCRWQYAIVERLHRIAHSIAETIQTYSWTFSATSELWAHRYFRVSIFSTQRYFLISVPSQTPDRKSMFYANIELTHTHTHTLHHHQ